MTNITEKSNTVLVQYVELHGDTGPLRALAREWGQHPAFLGAELLRSPEQKGLHLLACRWLKRVPELTLPEGAKAWAFIHVEDFER